MAETAESGIHENLISNIRNSIMECRRLAVSGTDKAVLLKKLDEADSLLSDASVLLYERPAELLRKILNTSQACIFWKDRNYRFLGVNQAFLDYYGFTSEHELIGRTDEDMGWNENPEAFAADEREVIEHGRKIWNAVGRCLCHGEYRTIRSSKSPLYIQGKIAGLVGVFEDIEEQAARSGT